MQRVATDTPARAGAIIQESAITQAVVLAAGNGSRLGLAAGVPKILARVVGRTLLDHQLATLRSLGVRDVILVTGYGG
ncbi:MAG: NTP transferase domain-containing protein, partial [Anaerolineae bacterium]